MSSQHPFPQHVLPTRNLFMAGIHIFRRKKSRQLASNLFDSTHVLLTFQWHRCR